MKKVLQNGGIRIVTHALGHNYGGIMQAYALQKILLVVSQNVATATFMKRSSLSYVKQSILSSIQRQAVVVCSRSIDKHIAGSNFKFIDKYINTVDTNHLRFARLLITGSDQVWRKSYVDVSKYMFGTIPDKSNAKRISYAASFGTEDLSEYGAELIATTANLAKKFDGISVREDSGVDIAKKYWGVDAEQHVDPTLLLDREEYMSLITEDENNLKESAGNLFVYVLDENSDKQSIINKVAIVRNLQPFSIMPKKNPTIIEWLRRKEDFVLPRVTQWLKSFKDAEFVITDSFHGCAFSIIFNKPFIAIGNKQRGVARFTSLLKLFSLEDRLVADASEVTEELLKSTYEEIWAKYRVVMDQTSRNKFRSIRDVNQYLLKHWQVASGNYKALVFRKISCYVSSFPEDMNRLKRAMDNSSCRMVCINDSQVGGDFQQSITEINELLNHRMPMRSSFERRM